jgi:hypothetical protein
MTHFMGNTRFKMVVSVVVSLLMAAQLALGGAAQFAKTAWAAGSLQLSAAYQVSSSADDVMMGSDGHAHSTQTSIYVDGPYAGMAMTSYIRFAGVNVPAGAQITKASITFYLYNTTTKVNTIDIAGQTNGGEALAIGDHASGYDTRDWTASTVCAIPATRLGTTYTTPDLSAQLNDMQAGLAQGAYVFKMQGLDGAATNSLTRFRTYNYGAKYAAQLNLEYSAQSGSATLKPSLTGCQSQEYGTLGAITHSNVMYLGGYRSYALSAASHQISALRFPDVVIPDNAVVDSASIQFNVDGSGIAGHSSQISVKAETSDAQVYPATAGSISARSVTPDAVTYIQTSLGSHHSLVQSGDLTLIIQEARACGWQSGQSLGFVFSGTDDIGTVYGGAIAAYAPVLTISYSYSATPFKIPGAIYDVVANGGLSINEVCSAGSSTIASSWVEFRNSQNVPIVLDTSTTLYRDSNKKDSYTFNDFIIPANGYRLLYCDGDSSLGNGHCSFELKDGATLELYQDGKEVTAATYVSGLAEGQSQGYAQSGTNQGDWITFVTPSPGLSNDQGTQAYTLTPSQARGVYAAGFSLTLTAYNASAIADPSIAIYYTNNGKTPSAASTLYTGPIDISETQVIRAIAINAQGQSPVMTDTYVLEDNYPNEVARGHATWLYKSSITADTYAAAIAALPAMCVCGDATTVGTTYAQSYVEYFGDGVTPFASPVGTKKYGQASLVQYDSNVDLRFKSDYGAGKAKYQFFQAAPGDKYALPKKYGKIQLEEGEDGPQQIQYDVGYNRYDDTVTRTLSTEMGNLDQNTRYVNYFYNGQYMGVKTMRNDFDDNTFSALFGGSNDDYTTVTYQDGTFNVGTVKSGDGDTTIDNKVLSASNSGNLQDVAQYVNLKNYISTQVLNMFIDCENEENAVVSTSVVSGNGSGTKMMFNINDDDGAFYNAGYADKLAHPLAGGGGTYRFKWDSNVATKEGPADIFGKYSGILTKTNLTDGNLEFKTLIKDAVYNAYGPTNAGQTDNSALGVPLSVSNVTNIIQDSINQLNVPYQLDAAFLGQYNNMYQRWLTNNKQVLAQLADRVAFNISEWKAYGLAHTLDPVSYDQDTNTLANTATNTAARARIYYTTNGSDPMGADGGVSRSAIVYTGGTLPATSGITVRAFTPGNWGPITSF